MLTLQAKSHKLDASQEKAVHEGSKVTARAGGTYLRMWWLSD